MPQTSNHQAAEYLAVADSLRNVRAQLAKAIHEGRALASWDAVSAVMVHGLTVAIALEEIAQHFTEKTT